MPFHFKRQRAPNSIKICKFKVYKRIVKSSYFTLVCKAICIYRQKQDTAEAIPCISFA